ncbi:MFS transporter [Cohaesibacter intestini]|uniref:MFS transporter n=1 Tax=Cohaesibacter intestini TaxID=2211145 RepID=UPI0018E50293|nr:MFS transporter [Cohaesibacter intestini]
MSETVMQPAGYSGWRTPRRAVVAMFFLNGSLYGIWASRVPAIAEMHQLSESLLGILLLSMAAGAIVSFPLAGKLVDLYGSAEVTKKIAFAYGATLVALAVAPNVWLLGLSLFLFGAAHGSMDVSMNAWAGEVERYLKKPIMSSFHAMWSLGTGAGAASGYVAVRLGAEPMLHFLVAASLCLALSLYFGLIPWKSPVAAGQKTDASEATPEAKPASAKKKRFPLPQGALALAGIIGFCSALGEGGMADWSAIFLVQVTAVDDGIAALGFATFSVVMVGMRLVGDRIITRLGAVRAARLSSLAAASGSLLAILAGTLPAALCGFALMGVGYALIFPLIFSRAANDDKLSPGAAIAAVATFGYGGGLLGPVLIGLLADIFFIRWAFLLLSALALVIAILAPVLAPPADNGSR